jgi:GNAT superfamily N-acetyltransferase
VIRRLTADDTAAAIDLLTEAGLGSGAAMIARYLRWPSAPYWGWFEGEALVGSCGAALMGRAAFVGGMAVRTARRSQGLGRRLLEHVHASLADVETWLLEATAEGEPLYASLGYQVEYETAMMMRPASVATLELPPLDGRALSAMIALDREATGVDRADMLRELVAEGLPAMVVERGYGFAFGGRMGPMIANDDSAGALLFAALAPGAGVVGVPAGNAAALASARDAGFVLQRRIKRMRRGPAVAIRPERVWALASAGLG